ncbi:MAG: choice-of-anchor D domain-containing protein, partial [Kofleriaceae bacterium]
MSKRWLGCIVLGILGWSGTALANLTASSPTVGVGNVAVTLPTGTTGTVSASASSDGTDLLDHFDIVGAGCTAFAIEATLPATVVTGTPLAFDVTFTPTARGLVSCTVSFKDILDAQIGNDFTITGTGTAPEITAPASVSFGNRRVDTAATLTTSSLITLRNTGENGLQITALTPSADFTIPSPPALPQTLAANATLAVTVVFNPSLPGTRNGTLVVASSDPITPSKNVGLTGTGTVATILVSDVAFGNVTTGATVSLPISVTNSAPANAGTLTVFSASISGSSAFTFDTNGTFGCLNATSCTFGAGVAAPQSINVRCNPGAGDVGLQTATVTFSSDSDPGGDSIASLSCTPRRADATVDPTTLDYGAAVDVGGSVAKTVTVTNSGNVDLNFTVAKVGARQAEYALAGCFSACIVPPTQNRTFTLTFNPTAVGTANITANVNSNDPDNATIPITVTATSVAPSITAPANVTFGNVEVVTTTTRTLTITNSGSADLLISTANLTLNDGSFAVATGSTGAQTVAAGASTSWDLTCTPTTAGAHTTPRFTITSNAFNGSPRNIPLSCTGTEGILVVIPTTIDFGGVAENTGPVIQQYKLRNTGNLPVATIAGVINPANVGYSFDPATPFPAQILPGAANEVTLNVRFTPLSGSDGGPATATFSGTWGTGAKPLRVPPVLTLDGDGLTTGFDVMPNAIAFGNVRFDQTATRTFCVENTSQATLSIQTITYAPAVGTMTGEFTTQSVRKKVCGSAGGTNIALPQTLAAGEQLEVTVLVDPAARVGAMAATATVTSNLAVNPTRTVALTATATTAGITLAPGATVDFGAVDIRGAAVTQDLVITNTGDGPLDLRTFTRSDGGSNTHFTFALPANTVLQPGEALTITVTYKPTVVTVPAESIVLSHQIIGILGGPANESITLTGSGADREIEVAGAPAFPDTFRNPGDAAPVRAIKVTNRGGVKLLLTMTMVTSADGGVWSLVNPPETEIPPGASQDVLVKFTPTSIGPFAATLTIMNDDGDEPMVDIQLTGNGIDRNVGFGSSIVNIGFTGIGIPITIDEALLVASMNATTGFTIARIGLADPDPSCMDAATALSGAQVFQIVDEPVNVDLAASSSLAFGVTFSPDSEGTFVASAELFVDQDP